MRFEKRIWAYVFNYFGIALTLALAYDAWRDSRRTEEFLRTVAHQQEHLRDLLWVNLLMQRSSNLILGSLHAPDGADELERAKNISSSIPRYLDAVDEDGRELTRFGLDEATRRAVSDFQTRLAGIDPAGIRTPRTRAQMSAIGPLVEEAGERLNRAESQEWFQLRELHGKLLANRQKQGGRMMLILGVMLSYLCFLGWVIHRKELAERTVKESEVKMLNTAKMSALGEMAGGIAHEINNPVATISTISQQAREVMDDQAPDFGFVKKSLESIHRTTLRISAIVNGLRAFSRDGASEPIQPTPVNEIVSSTLAFCQEKMKHLGICMQLDPVPAHLVIDCRSIQISQVLLNLVANACDAIADRPERWLKVAVAEREKDVEISVTDSGGGVAAQDAAKIFLPFFTTKGAGKGTGLGLSISKNIVESHGGKLFLDSRSEHTRFVISLPKQRPGQA